MVGKYNRLVLAGFLESNDGLNTDYEGGAFWRGGARTTAVERSALMQQSVT